VIGLDPSTLPPPSKKLDLPSSDKPKLGIAIRRSFAWAFVEALKEVRDALEPFDVWFYPYSRYHRHLEAHSMIKKALGSGFNYIETPLGPIDAYRFAERFDVVFNDTFHGTLSAIIHQKPFLTVRFREAPFSRRAELSARLGIEDRSIRIRDAWKPIGHDENRKALKDGLPRLLVNPQQVSLSALESARSEVEQHFDHLVAAMKA